MIILNEVLKLIIDSINNINNIGNTINGVYTNIQNNIVEPYIFIEPQNITNINNYLNNKCICVYYLSFFDKSTSNVNLVNVSNEVMNALMNLVDFTNNILNIIDLNISKIENNIIPNLNTICKIKFKVEIIVKII